MSLPNSIHAEQAPVNAYAQELANATGIARLVIEIPAGTAAHRMGYRFTTITEGDRAHYTQNGANVVAEMRPTAPRAS